MQYLPSLVALAILGTILYLQDYLKSGSRQTLDQIIKVRFGGALTNVGYGLVHQPITVLVLFSMFILIVPGFFGSLIALAVPQFEGSQIQNWSVFFDAMWTVLIAPFTFIKATIASFGAIWGGFKTHALLPWNLVLPNALLIGGGSTIFLYSVLEWDNRNFGKGDRWKLYIISFLVLSGLMFLYLGFVGNVEPSALTAWLESMGKPSAVTGPVDALGNPLGPVAGGGEWSLLNIIPLVVFFLVAFFWANGSFDGINLTPKKKKEPRKMDAKSCYARLSTAKALYAGFLEDIQIASQGIQKGVWGEQTEGNNEFMAVMSVMKAIPGQMQSNFIQLHLAAEDLRTKMDEGELTEDDLQVCQMLSNHYSPVHADLAESCEKIIQEAKAKAKAKK